MHAALRAQLRKVAARLVSQRALEQLTEGTRLARDTVSKCTAPSSRLTKPRGRYCIVEKVTISLD